MNQTRGIWLMILACLLLAIQDGLSRHLAENHSVFPIVMIRYWFFAAFALALAARQKGGLRAAFHTPRPGLQIFRALLLIAEICVAIYGFVKLGLVASQAIFACYPLLGTLLAASLLKERVGARGWIAAGLGAVGVLLIVQPGRDVFSPWATLPLLSAAMFALYGILTRKTASHDSTTTQLLWTATVGAAAITPLGLGQWPSMGAADWGWMGALCLASLAAHAVLIRAYDLALASTLQPFAYFQLLFGAGVGVLFFNEIVALHMTIGAAIVVFSGLLALSRRADQSPRVLGSR